MIYCWNARVVKHEKITQCNVPHNRLKKKNCLIIFIDEEKTFDKIQQSLVIKKKIQTTRNRRELPQYDEENL